MVQSKDMPYSAPALAIAVTLPVPILNPSKKIPGRINAKLLASFAGRELLLVLFSCDASFVVNASGD